MQFCVFINITWYIFKFVVFSLYIFNICHNTKKHVKSKRNQSNISWSRYIFHNTKKKIPTKNIGFSADRYHYRIQIKNPVKRKKNRSNKSWSGYITPTIFFVLTDSTFHSNIFPNCNDYQIMVMNPKTTKLSYILGVLEGETGDVFVSTQVIFSVFGYDLFEKEENWVNIKTERKRDRERDSWELRRN